MRFLSTKRQTGFTLIELLFSTALLSVIMMISIGTLLALVDANRKAQALQSVTNNLSFTLDSMTRTIRTGYNYYCSVDGLGWTPGATADCTAGNYFDFIDRFGKRVTYRNAANKIERNYDSKGWVAMTASEVTVTGMRFVVTGAKNTDAVQPTVTFMIQVTAGADPSTMTRFNLQTTVTQRILDI